AMSATSMLPPLPIQRRLRQLLFRGLTQAASAPADLRFAFRVAIHAQGSLPAGWLAFTGRASNPLDRCERFQLVLTTIPLTLRWLRNFEQYAKWNVGLTAGMFCLRIRSDDEETSPPEPHSGVQGESGLGCLEERSNDCTTC